MSSYDTCDSDDDRDAIEEARMIEAVLTKPARDAFSRLSRLDEISTARYEGHALVLRADIDILLMEVAQSVGMEVELSALQAIMARIAEMAKAAESDGTLSVRKIRALLAAFYSDGMQN